jgi:nucleoid-associated protein YgaU
MARTAATKKTKKQLEETPEKSPSFLDFLRFGESYTSLILGIIVVVIATALLLSFVHNKNAGNKNVTINEQTQNTVQLSQQQKILSSLPKSTIVDSVVSPTASPIPTAEPTVTPKPTIKLVAKPHPTIKPKAKITPKATITSKPIIAMKKPTVTPKPVVNKIAMTNTKKKATTNVNSNKGKNVWIVQKGESLWVIAEKIYSSGYNWVDIARANNLTNPGDIHAGDRLVLPSVSPKASTIATATVVSPKATHTAKPKKVATINSTKKVVNKTGTTGAITGKTYTVIKGDNLWNIAVRAYGDGFRWTDIARANNLANPRMIFSGNVLIIPRP